MCVCSDLFKASNWGGLKLETFFGHVLLNHLRGSSNAQMSPTGGFAAEARAAFIPGN